MSLDLLPSADGRCLPLWLIAEGDLPQWLEQQPATVRDWVRGHGFQGERHRVLTLPGPAGVGGAILGLGALGDATELRWWHVAGLGERLPPAAFRVASPLAPAAATQVALGWLLGGYRYGTYRAQPSGTRPALAAPPGADLPYVRAAATASTLARDLINTPANDLGPRELAHAATELARTHGARCEVLTGRELETQGFTLLHTVGMGSPRDPCLVDLRWGDPAAPRVTLVGKGICFDSGGLDIKPSAGMLLMKKDMGGAACALGLAHMLMALDAPVQLRVLIPAAENAVDGRSYRPGDVLRSKKGLTVEIGNTDAEGRLVLADALTAADAERPALLIDLATLTGAARTALGPELPAAYSGDEALLAELRRFGDQEADPVWPMPLWAGYDEDLASRIADIGNVASHAFAGSIIGALFLKRFVSTPASWLHLDIYGWNARERPGRPVGAEAQCVRSLYRLIRARFG